MDSDKYSLPRRYDRVAVSVPVMVVLENKGGPMLQTLYMVDASEHGVRLRGKAELSPGQIVELIPSEGPQYGVKGRVIWGKPFPDSQEADFGLEFLHPFPVKSWKLRERATA